MIMKNYFGIRWTVLAGTALVLIQAAPLHAADEFTLDTAQSAAAKGDAKAEYFLARHYAKGDGVPQDYSKAAEYMRQAAEQDYAFAQNDLGAFYAKGLGVRQDYQEAAKWYLKAAGQGDALAQYSLGLIYSEGRGVPVNMPESLKWYK